MGGDESEFGMRQKGRAVVGLSGRTVVEHLMGPAECSMEIVLPDEAVDDAAAGGAGVGETTDKRVSQTEEDDEPELENVPLPPLQPRTLTPPKDEVRPSRRSRARSISSSFSRRSCPVVPLERLGRVFDEAQEHVLTLMERDSWRRFIRTPAFWDIAQAEQAQAQSRREVALRVIGNKRPTTPSRSPTKPSLASHRPSQVCLGPSRSPPNNHRFSFADELADELELELATSSQQVRTSNPRSGSSVNRSRGNSAPASIRSITGAAPPSHLRTPSPGRRRPHVHRDLFGHVSPAMSPKMAESIGSASLDTSPGSSPRGPRAHLSKRLRAMSGHYFGAPSFAPTLPRIPSTTSGIRAHSPHSLPRAPSSAVFREPGADSEVSGGLLGVEERRAAQRTPASWSHGQLGGPSRQCAATAQLELCPSGSSGQCAVLIQL